jgi:predicted solute-binding protein
MALNILMKWWRKMNIPVYDLTKYYTENISYQLNARTNEKRLNLFLLAN